MTDFFWMWHVSVFQYWIENGVFYFTESCPLWVWNQENNIFNCTKGNWSRKYTIFTRPTVSFVYVIFFIQQITDDINYTTWCVLVTVANIHIKLKTDFKKIWIFSIHCVSVAVFMLKYDFVTALIGIWLLLLSCIISTERVSQVLHF